jgi:Xaa-Pro aminopeptidase
MVTSDEPGIYKEGKYGIRIENLQYTVQSAIGDGFLEFVPLTKAPVDKKLIDKSMLDAGELAWLNKYHEDVYNSLAPYLNEKEKLWLQNACSPL